MKDIKYEPGDMKPFGPPAQLAKVMEALKQKEGRKGVIEDKAVRPGQLSPMEAEKYKKIFKVFKDIVFPGPETGQLDSTSQKAVRRVGGKTQIGSSLMSKMGASGGDMKTWMGALGASILLMPWKDIFSSIWKSIRGAFGFADLVKALGIDEFLKMGKIKVLKAFEGMIDMFRNSKFMKTLEGGISSLAEFGDKLKNSKWGKNALVMIESFKNVFNGMEKMFSAVSKPLKAVGGAVFKGAGMLVKLVGGVGAKIGKALKFIPFVGSIFSFGIAMEAFGNGEYGRGIWELTSGVLNLIPGVGNAASMMMDGAALMYDLLSENKTGESTREFFGNIGGKLKELMGPIGDAVLGVFTFVGDSIGGVFDIFQNIVSGVFRKGFDIIKSGLSGVGLAGPLISMLDNAADFTSDMFGGSDSTSSTSSSQSSTQQMVSTQSSTQKELLELKKQEMKMYDFMCQKLDGIEKTNAAILASMDKPTASNKTTPLTTPSNALDTDFFATT